MFFVLPEVLVDGPFQLRHAAKGAAPEALPGNLRKPAIHQIEPRRPRGREVEIVTGCAAPHACTRGYLCVP